MITELPAASAGASFLTDMSKGWLKGCTLHQDKPCDHHRVEYAHCNLSHTAQWDSLHVVQKQTSSRLNASLLEQSQHK